MFSLFELEVLAKVRQRELLREAERLRIVALAEGSSNANEGVLARVFRWKRAARAESHELLLREERR